MMYWRSVSEPPEMCDIVLATYEALNGERVVLEASWQDFGWALAHIEDLEMLEEDEERQDGFKAWMPLPFPYERRPIRK